MPIKSRHRLIINALLANPGKSISSIKDLIGEKVSIPTLNRDIKQLLEEGLLVKLGAGRNIVYEVAKSFQLLNNDIGASYFDKDVDEREGNKKFDPSIFTLLSSTPLFNQSEIKELKKLHQLYQKKLQFISPVLLQKETERLTIELSWKSSQIEGNTYSLLETELLLLEKKLAKDKDKSEAIMLLNHKIAMDYIYEQRIPMWLLKVSAIENIHSR